MKICRKLSHVRYILYYVKEDTVALYSFDDCK
jgi:hypothetical protein